MELTDEQKKKSKNLKRLFRLYFEGIPYETFGVEPIVSIPVRDFEITDIQFEFKKDMIDMIITLGRPGLLIGRKAETIDNLQVFLSEREGDKVRLIVNESKLWV